MENEDSADQSTPGPRQNGLDLEHLNRRHMHSIDKWYRMCAGAGSQITAFEKGTIYLAITIDERLQPPFEEVVGKIARSWLHEEELKNASQYVAVIFRTDGRLGTLIPAKAATPRRVVDELRPATKPDVPITVISGALYDTAA